MAELNPAVADRWRIVTAAPHRLLFLGGVFQLLAAMAWWLASLARLYAGEPPLLAADLAPVWVHMFLMLFGVFSFFIFGFLLTVYPRWMNAPAVPQERYVTVALLLAAGVAVYYLGLAAGRWVMAAGVALMWLAFAAALRALLAVYVRARTRGLHERGVNLALVAALLALAAYLGALLGGGPRLFLLAQELGLWLFLVPVVFTVSHRMIPFFSSTVIPDYAVIRPAWGLPVLFLGAAGHAALEWLGWNRWLFLVDLPLAAAALYHSAIWQFRRGLGVRLLAVLHVSFLWLGVALALYGVQSLALLATEHYFLGRAPLHALTIGFIAGMALAMVSRVTLGHSGRALVADRLTWHCFLGLNLAAAARIGAALAPGRAGEWLNLAAAVLWLASFAPWVARYGPVYLRARSDGQPG